MTNQSITNASTEQEIKQKKLETQQAMQQNMQIHRFNVDCNHLSIQTIKAAYDTVTAMGNNITSNGTIAIGDLTEQAKTSVDKCGEMHNALLIQLHSLICPEKKPVNVEINQNVAPAKSVNNSENITV